MTKFWLTIGVVSFLLVGCAESDVNKDKQGVTEEAEKSSGDAVIEPENMNMETVQSPVDLSVSDVKLNPAHGQPGHDCAIAVGAPLDGSGGKSQVTSPSVQPMVQPMTQPLAQPKIPSGTPTGGLNPAHGEPGHDCAVAVGAPLPVK